MRGFFGIWWDYQPATLTSGRSRLSFPVAWARQSSGVLQFAGSLAMSCHSGYDANAMGNSNRLAASDSRARWGALVRWLRLRRLWLFDRRTCTVRNRRDRHRNICLQRLLQRRQVLACLRRVELRMTLRLL